MTSKPIATISYNTKEFLDHVLDTLLNGSFITDYRYIFHTGEDGDKDHYHVWMNPNKSLDLNALRLEFNQFIPGCEKPLGCMPFVKSEPKNWLMYAIHDADYLALHHSDNDGDGKIPYSINDVVTPFPEMLERVFKSATAEFNNSVNRTIIDELEKGTPPHIICVRYGYNPVTVRALVALYDHAPVRNCKPYAVDEDGVIQTD